MSEPQHVLFGATLRAFRTQAKLSQFELAILLEWKGTTPIVLMEQGKRIPHLDTLSRVCDALRLSYADRCYLAGLAGYGYTTTLPSLDQIVTVLDHIDNKIRDLPYPAYVIDYRFRCWMANAAASIFVEGDRGKLESLATQGVTIFDLAFNSDLPPSRFSANRQQIEIEHIFRFKAYNLFRRHEPFYVAYPEVMANRLRHDDYQRFMEAWNATDALTMWQMFSHHVPIDMHINGSVLEFMMVDQPSIHLQSMFIITSYEPKPTPRNQSLAEAVFSNAFFVGKPCIRAWELTGVEAWNHHPLTAPAPGSVSE